MVFVVAVAFGRTTGQWLPVALQVQAMGTAGTELGSHAGHDMSAGNEVKTVRQGSGSFWSSVYG